MKRALPLTLLQLAPDRWRVAWAGRAPFECNTPSLRAVLSQLTPRQQRAVIRAALREIEEATP
jgi:hypothetical protein